jgi:hypothetical protein
MRVKTGVLAVLAVVAATAAGCDRYSYGSSGYDYGPSFGRVRGYQPGSDYGSSSSSSKWDYYRNYRGNLHPGPETP